MYNRIPPDGIASEDGIQTAVETDCGGNALEHIVENILERIDDVQHIDSNSCHGQSDILQENTVSKVDSDQDASVLQMAFIQMMTQKVLEATRNHPDILEQVNSKIRTDRE